MQTSLTWRCSCWGSPWAVLLPPLIFSPSKAASDERTGARVELPPHGFSSDRVCRAFATAVATAAITTAIAPTTIPTALATTLTTSSFTTTSALAAATSATAVAAAAIATSLATTTIAAPSLTFTFDPVYLHLHSCAWGLQQRLLRRPWPEHP